MTRNAVKGLAVAMLLAGIIGFASPRFLGFNLTPRHNVIHLLTGAAAAATAWLGGDAAVRRSCTVICGLYSILTVLGFVLPGVLAMLLGSPGLSARELMRDNLLHLAVTAVTIAALRSAVVSESP